MMRDKSSALVVSITALLSAPEKNKHNSGLGDSLPEFHGLDHGIFLIGRVNLVWEGGSQPGEAADR